MTIKKTLQPKDTVEMRTDFFVQQRGETYKQVNPIVWNNEWRLKGQIGWRNVLTIIIIITLFYYGSKYVHFYEEFHVNPTLVYNNYIQELAAQGIFLNEVDNEYTITIPINNKED